MNGFELRDFLKANVREVQVNKTMRFIYENITVNSLSRQDKISTGSV